MNFVQHRTLFVVLSCEMQYNLHTSKHSDQAVKVSSQVAFCEQIVQQDYCSDIPHRRLAMAKKNPQLEPEICFLLLLFLTRRSFFISSGVVCVVSRDEALTTSVRWAANREHLWFHVITTQEETDLFQWVTQTRHTHTHVNKHKVRSFYGVSGFIYLLDTSGLPLVSTASGNVPRALRTLTPGHRSGLKMSRSL